MMHNLRLNSIIQQSKQSPEAYEVKGLHDTEAIIMCQRLGKKRRHSCISTSSDCSTDISSKPARRVSFCQSPLPNDKPRFSCNVCEDSTRENNTFTADHDKIWYSKSELASFARQARDHVMGLGCYWVDQCTRGYERYDFARAEQKTMTRKVIVLLMQQEGLTDEEKSLVASRSSAWAVEDAFLTGCKDFCEAYHPHMTHLLQQQSSQEQSNLNDDN